MIDNSKPRPPMVLFLVVRYLMILFPLTASVGFLLNNAGFPIWACLLVGTMLSSWVVGKYEEILIEVKEYINTK